MQGSQGQDVGHGARRLAVGDTQMGDVAFRLRLV